MRHWCKLALLSLASLASLAPSLLSCATYVGPPTPKLVGFENGLLPDPNAPVAIEFDKPVDRASVHVKIVRLVTDSRRRLADEDDDPDTALDLLFSHDDGDPDFGGSIAFRNGDTRIEITPRATLPIGNRLALLLEPGLASTSGESTAVRKRLPFAYAFKLDCNKPSTVMKDGTYYFLFDVINPIKTQVQLLASIKIDKATGAFIGQFTNADRNPDPARCSPACKSSEACRTLPGPPACVIPSEKAGSADEFPDYLPNATPPTGYSFTARGCAVDQPDGTALCANVPFDMKVEQPAVTLRAGKMTASFKVDASGVLRGGGTINAGDVLLGVISSGPADGGLTARILPADKVPPGVPQPPDK